MHWRFENVGRLMNRTVDIFEEEVIALIDKQEFPGMRRTHIKLIRNLDAKGTRAIDLAARAQMTKQAMAEQIQQCEAAGIIYREADETDGRAKIVKLTPHGMNLMHQLRDAVAKAEAQMEAVVGKRKLEAILGSLRKYIAKH